MRQVAEPYIRRKAIRHLKRNGLLFLQQVREILTSQQIRQQHFVQLKLKRMSF